MASAVKMSFAERQMQKMGYQFGKGLGKDATGIVQPIETNVRQERAGLGYNSELDRSADFPDSASADKSEEDVPKWEYVQGEEGADEDTWGWAPSATALYLANLPPKTEPAYLAKLLGKKGMANIIEMFCQTDGRDRIAYVTYKNADDAAAAADLYQGQFWGPSNLRVIAAVTKEEVVTAKVAEGGTWLVWSDFKKTDHVGTPTRTVLMKNLPVLHTTRALKNLLVDFGFEDEIKFKLDPSKPDNATLTFPSVEVAKHFVNTYHGNYVKSGTVYCEFVPEGASVPKKGSSGPKEGSSGLKEGSSLSKEGQPTTKEGSPITTVHVSGLRMGFTEAELRRLFDPVNLVKVTIPSRRGRFAFVNIATDILNSTLQSFPKVFDGHRIKVQVAKTRKG